ncbi:sodium/myo-inositol cotransporter 2-like [Amphiura filiformis]|uniref:sodium/myo-inositol cotransporter 2-like n=1 Tax=Amphiura filiformis TaxID=82378 RepID=UPI003B227BB5
MAYDGMHPADIAIIVLYFVFVIFVGLLSMYKSHRSNAQGYFLAGRSMLWFPVGASLFASNIGTGHFIGLAGTGATSGIAVGAYEIMSVFALVFLGWVFLPVYVSAGVYTMPEYLKKRYGGQRLRLFMSVLALFLYIFTKISVDIFAGAVFIQQAFDWNIYVSIVILLSITGIYTITGGLAAVIYTDTLQTTIMVIGGFALTGISYAKVGGYEELKIKYMQAIPSTHINDTETGCGVPRMDSFNIMRDPVDSDQPWPGTIMGIMVIGIWYWCTDQVIVQRALAAKNVTHAKGGAILAGYLKLLPMYLIIIPGMISRVLFPDEVACVDPEVCKEVCGTEVGCSNIAYSKLVLELMPIGVRGLMVAVMMAALMSSLTSIFNSGSTIFTMDIWRRIRRHATNTELMIVGRVFIVVLLAISILWIPIVQSSQSGQLFIYIQSLQSYFAPPIFICFVMGVAWRRVNEKGAFWGLVCGCAMGVTRMILDIIYPAPPCGEPETRPPIVYKVHYLYYNCMVAVVSCVVTTVISLLTEEPPAERVIGTTYSTRGYTSSSKEEIREDNRDDAEEMTPMNVKDVKEVIDDISDTPEKSLPKWRQGIYWFCGYNPAERQSLPDSDEMIRSIAEKPRWRKFVLINMILVTGVAFFLMGLYW